MNTIRKTLLLLATFACTAVSIAQVEEGIVTAKQSFDADDPEVKSQIAMLGEMEITTYIKDNKTRIEQSGGMTGTNITITDGDTGESLVLMNNPFLGKKFVKSDGDNDPKMPDMDIERTKETKEFLGHTCHKYIITGEEIDIVMYCAEDLPMQEGTDKYYGKVKGYPLYSVTEINQMGMSLKVITEVTKIEKTKVDGKKFKMTVPEGYEETSAEELGKMGK